MKSCSVFHIEQKMEFEKFNCFFIDYLRNIFGRIKVISTVVERKYTLDITRQICFAYQLTDFYMLRSFTERYFLKNYIYILENHFFFVNMLDYYFRASLSRIFCVNSSVKVLPSWYEGPSIHLFHTSSLCTFIIYRMKAIVRFRS